MPWKAVGNKIVRADTGKVVGHSKSHAMAQASVRARYANAGPEAQASSGKSKGFGHFGAASTTAAHKKGK